MQGQPSGTVTLVFTDIEGSTRLLAELGTEGYKRALARHRSAVREAFGRHQGYEVDYEGDAFFYAFGSATGAVAAAREAVVALAGGPIRVRVGIHTGEPGLDPPKYVGMDVHRAARIMAAAHGGQVVLSQSTRDLLDEHQLRDLGEHRLKDLAAPIRLYQLGEDEFPPIKSLYRTNLEGFQNLGSRSCCGSVVLVYEAAESVATLDPAGGRWIARVDPIGCQERESSVGTLAVVMHGVGA